MSIIEFIKQDVWNPLVDLLSSENTACRDAVNFYYQALKKEKRDYSGRKRKKLFDGVEEEEHENSKLIEKSLLNAREFDRPFNESVLNESDKDLFYNSIDHGKGVNLEGMRNPQQYSQHLEYNLPSKENAYQNTLIKQNPLLLRQNPPALIRTDYATNAINGNYGFQSTPNNLRDSRNILQQPLKFGTSVNSQNPSTIIRSHNPTTNLY